MLAAAAEFTPMLWYISEWNGFLNIKKNACLLSIRCWLACESMHCLWLILFFLQYVEFQASIKPLLSWLCSSSQQSRPARWEETEERGWMSKGGERRVLKTGERSLGGEESVELSFPSFIYFRSILSVSSLKLSSDPSAHLVTSRHHLMTDGKRQHNLKVRKIVKC